MILRGILTSIHPMIKIRLINLVQSACQILTKNQETHFSKEKSFADNFSKLFMIRFTLRANKTQTLSKVSN